MSTRQLSDALVQMRDQRDALLAALKSTRDAVAQIDPDHPVLVMANRAIANTVANPVRIEPPAHLTLADDGPDNTAWRAA